MDKFLFLIVLILLGLSTKANSNEADLDYVQEIADQWAFEAQENARPGRINKEIFITYANTVPIS